MAGSAPGAGSTDARGGTPAVVGVNDRGQAYPIARNRVSNPEFAGPWARLAGAGGVGTGSLGSAGLGS